MKIINNGSGIYSLFRNSMALRIDANVGGRITSLRLNGYEFLQQERENEENYGSTFWPSPQSIWGWPPIKIFDEDKYSVVDDKKLIELQSNVDSLTGYSITKIIQPSKNKDSFELEFRITNKSGKKSSVAPWQITRVKKGGLLFFSIGEGEQKPKNFPMVKTEKIDDVIWYQTNPGEILENHLSNIADCSEGWIAYAIDERLFIKKFIDHRPDKFAPGEAEILFYTSCNQNYIEIEIQGAYESLVPEEFLIWKLEWFAVEIPKGIEIFPGSKEILAFVRKVLGIA